jgi:transcriptional regulator with XRE-family HTH domain
MPENIAYIKPRMLKWAREEWANLTKEEVAKKMKLSSLDLEKIEQGDKKISLDQMREFGEIYNISSLFFYRNNPPSEDKLKEWKLEKELLRIREEFNLKMIMYASEKKVVQLTSDDNWTLLEKEEDKN